MCTQDTPPLYHPLYLSNYLQRHLTLWNSQVDRGSETGLPHTGQCDSKKDVILDGHLQRPPASSFVLYDCAHMYTLQLQRYATQTIQGSDTPLAPLSWCSFASRRVSSPLSAILTYQTSHTPTLSHVKEKVLSHYHR